jgi:hypothetical protein
MTLHASSAPPSTPPAFGRAALGGAIAALAVFVVAWRVLDAPAVAPEAAPAPAPALVRWRLEPGQRLTHHVVFHEEAQKDTSAGRGAGFAAVTDLDVVVASEGVSVDGDVSVVRVSFDAVDRANSVINGADVIDDAARAALVDDHAVAVVSVGADGVVVALDVDVDAHPLFVRLLQLVHSHSQMRLTPGRWQERDLHGVTDVDIAVVAAVDGAQVTRTPVAVTLDTPSRSGTRHAVSGGRRASVREGHIVELQGHERRSAVSEQNAPLVLVDATIAMTLLTSTSTPASRPLPAQTRTASTTSLQRDDARAEESQLNDRIGALTASTLLSTLDAALPGGAAPDHNAFLWSATGLLQREPALAAEVAARFARAADEPGRALVLDLLVGAETPVAQAALVELLSSPAAEADAARDLYRQRLSLVRAPTAATLAAVAGHLDDADRFWRWPARMAQGALAGTFAGAGQEAEATALVAPLLTRLAQSEGDERVLLLKALGNAGPAAGADAPLIAAAADPDPKVRHAAAAGLRQQHAAEARAALLTLAVDPAAAVSRRALESLARHPYGDDIARHLDTALIDGRLPPSALQPLVSLVAKHVDTSGETRALLEHILDVDVADRDVKGRVRQILAQHAP